MNNLGKRLKTLRKINSFSQRQLATKIGVSPSLISAYETDSRSPSYEALIQYSHIFHVSIDYLLGQNAYTSILVNDLNEYQIIYLSKVIANLRQQSK